MEINDRAVLLTGASGGLGTVMSERLLAEGFTVFAASRHPRADGPGIPITMDVADAASVAAAVTEITRHVGDRGLHAVVNNAAILHAGPVDLLPTEHVHEQLQTNIAGVITVTTACLPLLERSGGRIVNVGSINAQLPLPYWSIYSATKAAVAALSDAWRLELAPRNISVVLLTLGAFDTAIRRTGLRAWTGLDRPGGALRANTALVNVLDATATDPRVAADALAGVLGAAQPDAHVHLGDGIAELVALATQPPATRDLVLGQLLAAAT